MKLTIIIVNYNVRHFLKQCLQSVEHAAKKTDCEVFVVDNNSVDGSVSMLKNEFPRVKLIANKKNVGFSKANNQAIKQASGDYLLLLNPDTVVEEDTFLKVTQFMDNHQDAGGLGVKMIDGNGGFLPESKRGLPTPLVAFYKISGLASLFPQSKKFGQYHLKYLNKEENHEVDVLSGAFMLLRKKVIDQIGGLDETFFMYGEDIDLSYRITKAGYKNYYYAGTTIIHYKGESTKKESINYVMVFYNAMIIFAKKHFARRYASLFSLLIRLAIMMSAGLAIIKRVVRKLAFPVVDFFSVWAGFWLLTPFWEQYHFRTDSWFPDYYITNVVPLYIVAWIISLVYSGGYDKPHKMINVFKGVGWGVLFLLIVYALLPEELRFSRVMLLLGALWASIILPLTRIAYSYIKRAGHKTDTPNAIVVGEKDALQTLSKILSAQSFETIIGYVATRNYTPNDALGNLENIEDVVRVNQVNEIIFSAHHLYSRTIIRLMVKFGDPRIRFKIVSPDGISVIGSSTIQSLDDVYSVDVNTINKPTNKRFKRTFDVFIALFLLITYPISVFTISNKPRLIQNIWSVLKGSRSWVGFADTPDLHELPPIRKGVLNPVMLQKKRQLPDNIRQRLNMIYAKDYRLINDLAIVFRLWKHLGD